MNIRFFILQAHYRSTLDFSNEALQAADKGYRRLMEAWKLIPSLSASPASTQDVATIRQECFASMEDDFNTPMVIASLFEGVRIVNSVKAGTETLTSGDLALLKDTFDTFLSRILGLADETATPATDKVEGLLKLLVDLRLEARARKDWAASDQIRDRLKDLGVQLKDGKEGTTWSY